MKKRFAIQRIRDEKKEFASYVTFKGLTIPHIPEERWGDIQEAFLFMDYQLEAKRDKKTTEELLKRYYPDYQLVEVEIVLKASS